METDLLKKARQRAGKRALRYGAASSIKWAILLFCVGYATQIGAVALVLVLFIPFLVVMGGVYSALRNPELVRKELEEMAQEQEVLLVGYEKDLATNARQLNMKREDIEVYVRQEIQKWKDAEVKRIEDPLRALRELLAKASREERIKDQEYFLTMEQEFREIEILIEAMRAYDITDLQEEAARIAVEKYHSDCDKVLKPRAAELQIKVAQSKQSLGEVRRLIAEL